MNSPIQKLCKTCSYIDKLIIDVFEPCSLVVVNITQEIESKNYDACSFELSNLKVVYRNAKTTPTKIGQFVTLWKRILNGTTQPYDINDSFDIVIINSQHDQHLGQFVFPKSVLIEKGIISANSNTGKRGFRVYPPWDEVSNTQAINTQKWQLDYFLPNTRPIDFKRAKELFFQL